MLASAAGLFKGRRIYATGGNDNTVAIWDLTDHPVDTVDLTPISNGKVSVVVLLNRVTSILTLS